MRESSRASKGGIGGGARPPGLWGLAAPGLVGVLVASACSTTKPTELVPGVMTQVQVPKDLRAIQVEVDANGRNVFCQGYDVDESGIVELPATLGVVSGTTPETTIKVTIRGYDDPGAQTMNYLNCPDPTPAGPAPAPRVLRSSVQTFVDQHTLFLPMPLSYSCYDLDCSAPDACSSGECVCKGAQCVDSSTNALTLADFDPTLIDGTGICFNPSKCFQDAIDAVLVDPTNCTYAAPLGLGINVRVFYEDVTITSSSASPPLFQQEVSASGESEILSEDPQEGFCVGSCGASGGDGGAQDGGAQDGGQAGGDAGPLALQSFQLAPGLCNLVQAATSPPQLPAANTTLTYHAISSVQVATDCPAKSDLLPICAGQRNNNGLFPDGAAPDGGTVVESSNTLEETADGAALTCGGQVTLTSTPSVVYLVMDDSSVMSGAFGSSGYATVMSLSLSNPAFDTTYAAFRFFPESSNDAGTFDQSDCTSATTPFSTPTVLFGVAPQVQSQIANLLQTWSSPGDTPSNPAPLDLQAALRPDVGAYAAVRSFLQGRETPNVAAVMAFVNRTPDATNDCNPPLEGAQDVEGAIEAEIQAAYGGTPSIQTYFVVLGNSSGSDGSSNVLDFYLSIQTDLPQMVTVIDATLPMTQGQQVLENFADGTLQLGTCLYEPVAGVGISALAYTDPTDPQNLLPIPSNDQCTSANRSTVDGWGLDNGRIRVCGASCTDIQQAILAASAVAQQSGVSDVVSVEGTVSCAGVSNESEDAGATGSGDATVDGASDEDGSGASGSGSTTVASADGSAVSL
ncbi:MAG TPA: hypothetical protein VEK07_03700 [Polyangiaceae bacterium]|nr:hypothetical protein [Polyangiaceae bacterium]